MSSPPSSPGKSPHKPVTRFGTVKSIEPKFPLEERFSWQKAKFTTDTVYDLPEMKMNRSVSFSCSRRVGMDESQNPDNKKNSTGPGSYDVGQSFGFNSEYSTPRTSKFGVAPRQSMAMKTPSPGAVYDISNQYWNGPVKNRGISFSGESRNASYSTPAGANADMMWPKLRSGPAITMGARFKEKTLSSTGPGAVYDVHKAVDFRTGPSFSFGKTKHPNRFKEVGFLPELD